MGSEILSVMACPLYGVNSNILGSFACINSGSGLGRSTYPVVRICEATSTCSGTARSRVSGVCHVDVVVRLPRAGFSAGGRSRPPVCGAFLPVRQPCSVGPHTPFGDGARVSTAREARHDYSDLPCFAGIQPDLSDLHSNSRFVRRATRLRHIRCRVGHRGRRARRWNVRARSMDCDRRRSSPRRPFATVPDRTDTEFTYIVSGRANLTDHASGEVVEIGAGNFVILPPGWTGRWDIIEPVRKVYAIY
ncbi:cupin domain-containing protein [Burkholderia sp. 22PA0106]|uniref:cupin domain-containing protein n=1 Tax=Burkholderia sp. 22PA0106 TaxID=3237371 RepID=UPI0039C48224